jgi:hypothetical protein
MTGVMSGSMMSRDIRGGRARGIRTAWEGKVLDIGLWDIGMRDVEYGVEYGMYGLHECFYY